MEFLALTLTFPDFSSFFQIKREPIVSQIIFFIWCVAFKFYIRFYLYSRLNLDMKCSCLALFLLFYMIHDDCVIFHCIKDADSVSVQNIFLKIMMIIKIQGKGAST